MKITHAVLLALVLSATAWANDYREMAKDYYDYKNNNLIENLNPCRPTTSCFKVACDFLGNFECDDFNEQEQIRNACKGVFGGECISKATSFLSRFEYDQLDEMSSLIGSCRGVYDLDCIQYSCQRMGRFGCDELEELIQVNRACAYEYND